MSVLRVGYAKGWDWEYIKKVRTEEVGPLESELHSLFSGWRSPVFFIHSDYTGMKAKEVYKLPLKKASNLFEKHIKTCGLAVIN